MLLMFSEMHKTVPEQEEKTLPNIHLISNSKFPKYDNRACFLNAA
jgi:hypothetical protein